MTQQDQIDSTIRAREALDAVPDSTFYDEDEVEEALNLAVDLLLLAVVEHAADLDDLTERLSNSVAEMRDRRDL